MLHTMVCFLDILGCKIVGFHNVTFDGGFIELGMEHNAQISVVASRGSFLLLNCFWFRQHV